MSTVENYLDVCGHCYGRGEVAVAHWLRAVYEKCSPCGGTGVECNGYSSTTSETGPACGACCADGCPMRRVGWWRGDASERTA